MDYSLGQYIHDIHAGAGYNHLRNKPGVLGAIFNTDGVQPYKSSTVSVWPLCIALSNLPPSIRMNRDNIVTIAVWVGSKPPMDVLFAPLQEAVTRLSEPNGLTIQLPDGTKSFTVSLLFGVFDLIAKAPILNMHQHNGCNGCSVCLHPGESFSQRRVYAAGFNYQDRTHEMYVDDATKAITKGTIVNGVKGASPLTDLVKAFLLIICTVLEGVTKRLLEVWVKSTNSAAYIGPSMGRVDKSLLMQHPHDFSRPPRSILKHRKYWKAIASLETGYCITPYLSFQVNFLPFLPTTMPFLYVLFICYYRTS